MSTATDSPPLVEDLLRHLRAARLEARIYDAAHPRRQARVEELRVAVTATAGQGPVVFGIDGDTLSVNGLRVEDPVSDELVDILRERMIQRISINRDARNEDFEMLLGILTRAAALPCTDDAPRYESPYLTIDYFEGFLDLDGGGAGSGESQEDDIWRDFAPEQIAAIRMVTQDQAVQNKITRIDQCGGAAATDPQAVDFVQRFFRLLATDSSTNWQSADDLKATFLAGLDLVHEAQLARDETGEVPQHILSGNGVSDQLQARRRWKIIGGLFSSEESSPRTGDDEPFENNGPVIDLEGIEAIEPGAFPSELGDVITGRFSTLVDLEFYTKTLHALSELEVETDGWDETYAGQLSSAATDDFEPSALLSRFLTEPELLSFFQESLAHPEIFRSLRTSLVVDLCVRGREAELQEFLLQDPSSFSAGETPKRDSLAILSALIHDEGHRALDLAYALILKAEPTDRWTGAWGRWLIERALETRSLATWLRNRADSLLEPSQFPFFLSLPDEVTGELKEAVEGLGEETLLCFLTAIKDQPDCCPLGYLVSASRHEATSVRCLAIQCLSKRTDAASVGILFHRLQTCGADGAADDELTYIFEGLESRLDVDVQPRLKEIIGAKVGWKWAYPREIRQRAKSALKRIKKRRKSHG